MPPRKAFPLRLQAELYEALRLWADDELRSVNAQIEFLLTRAVQDAGRKRRPPPAPETGQEEVDRT